mmetsp:Transcript_19264/g.55913  ORF Transcript_19264/g.55913 Transcript_19264/m.55913 type:complete len:327 (+) Transcript_19264:1341-2321(+)
MIQHLAMDAPLVSPMSLKSPAASFAAERLAWKSSFSKRYHSAKEFRARPCIRLSPTSRKSFRALVLPRRPSSSRPQLMSAAPREYQARASFFESSAALKRFAASLAACRAPLKLCLLCCTEAFSRATSASSLRSPASCAMSPASSRQSRASARLGLPPSAWPASAMARSMQAWPRLSPLSSKLFNSSRICISASSSILMASTALPLARSATAFMRVACMVRRRLSAKPIASPISRKMVTASFAEIRASAGASSPRWPSATEKSMAASRFFPDELPSSAAEVYLPRRLSDIRSGLLPQPMAAMPRLTSLAPAACMVPGDRGGQRARA